LNDAPAHPPPPVPPAAAPPPPEPDPVAAPAPEALPVEASSPPPPEAEAKETQEPVLTPETVPDAPPPKSPVPAASDSPPRTPAASPSSVRSPIPAGRDLPPRRPSPAVTDRPTLPPPRSEHHPIAAGQFARANHVVPSEDFEYGLRLLLTCCKLDPSNLIYRQALRQSQRTCSERRGRARWLTWLMTLWPRLRLR